MRREKIMIEKVKKGFIRFLLLLGYSISKLAFRIDMEYCLAYAEKKRKESRAMVFIDEEKKFDDYVERRIC